MKLEWNVYVEDWNSKKIKTFNVFNHAKFYEDIQKNFKKFDNKEEFAEEIRKSLAWCYWSKCEWEIVISSFPVRIARDEFDRLSNEFKKDTERYGHEPYSMWVSPIVSKKVDVYEQILLNWNAFIDYLWSHKRSKKNGLAK